MVVATILIEVESSVLDNGGSNEIMRSLMLSLQVTNI
ncbi:predicted protein [Plenodomus lingam JN3]|uniref:Predicted protein n=1 Tax=Leptosphaeria maculans (strain JN3 / isolate v23.1.3 / race Av1-4-5-6-7-8) TaxID=985895 RepID=E4ZW96_LEPMJ|nr:predicted protein [Plenodomus lingam JN3]CBX95872.1 predicted protein [Plenodomus lingam JN3]